MKSLIVIPLALISVGMVMVMGAMGWGCYPKECDPAKDPTGCRCPPGACGPYPSPMPIPPIRSGSDAADETYSDASVDALHDAMIDAGIGVL